MAAYRQVRNPKRQTYRGGHGFLPDRQVRRAAHFSLAVAPRNFLLHMADAPHLEQKRFRNIRRHGINQ
jgi:hypothetical protein